MYDVIHSSVCKLEQDPRLKMLPEYQVRRFLQHIHTYVIILVEKSANIIIVQC